MTFLDYLQVSIVVIVLAVIATKAIYLRLATGINPIVIASSKGAWRIVEILSLASVLLWLTEVILQAFHSRYDIFPKRLGFDFLDGFVVKILGAGFVGLGLVTFLSAFFSFGKSWRIGIDRKTPGTLVTGGIFGLTRNPIYVASNLYFTGIFLINGTWFFLIFALLAAIACHFQILREEEFLRRQYGRDFEDYCQRTGRYFIW
jgi:protein-S-isoprenylcysteine O-methyltransferase Ste14